MSVSLEVGANTNENLQLAGQTIGSLRNNEAIAGVFGIEAGHTASVGDEADGDYENVDDAYVIEDGDYIRFSKPAGEKGK
jgi:hypothetical protein